MWLFELFVEVLEQPVIDKVTISSNKLNLIDFILSLTCT